MPRGIVTSENVSKPGISLSSIQCVKAWNLFLFICNQEQILCTSCIFGEAACVHIERHLWKLHDSEFWLVKKRHCTDLKNRRLIVVVRPPVFTVARQKWHQRHVWTSWKLLTLLWRFWSNCPSRLRLSFFTFSWFSYRIKSSSRHFWSTTINLILISLSELVFRLNTLQQQGLLCVRKS